MFYGTSTRGEKEMLPSESKVCELNPSQNDLSTSHPDPVLMEALPNTPDGELTGDDTTDKIVS